MQPSKSKIPIFLVTGFLGSGKTTFLSFNAQHAGSRRIVFLVNEYGDLNLDERLIAATQGATHSIVGGSLFCECKAADFIKVMTETVLAQHATRPIDAVIIETSGIADPYGIGSLIALHHLNEHFAIRSIITIVSAKNIQKLLKNLPVVHAQITCSDRILLNKTDLVEPSEISTIESVLHQLNPLATLTQTQYGKCRIDWDTTERTIPNEPLSSCESNPFSTRHMEWKGSVDCTRLRSWLSELPNEVLRVKGYVHTERGCQHIEHTVEGTIMLEVEDQTRSQLVMIVHDQDEALLEDLTQTLKSTLGITDFV